MSNTCPHAAEAAREATWPAGAKMVSIKALKRHPRNARTHSKRQIKKIAASIERFGFVNPVLIDEANKIIAGHGRVAAVKLLGWLEVPTLRIEHLSEAEKRAYVLADNRLAEDAGWDREMLAVELQGLIECDFSIELTGFEIAEVDRILEADAEAKSDCDSRDDEIPEIPNSASAVTRPGDLWILDSHRLLCGDATDPGAYVTLLADANASMIFTDPPYNVRIDGNVSGLGKTRHRDFAMASGEMSFEEFRGFLETVFTNMADHSIDGSIHFVCMDWRHMAETFSAGSAIYAELKNVCVWVKSNGGMGTFYRSRHELVFAFKNGTAPHINNFELGQTGRHRTNVWEYAGVNTFGPDRDQALAMHPTVKPVALIADAIRDCAKHRQIVLDPFAGSGSTVIAAEKTGRRAYVIELDPLYCDTIIRRWQSYTGKQAVHAVTGKTFEDVEDQLLAEATDSSSTITNEFASTCQARSEYS